MAPGARDFFADSKSGMTVTVKANGNSAAAAAGFGLCKQAHRWRSFAFEGSLAFAGNANESVHLCKMRKPGGVGKDSPGRVGQPAELSAADGGGWMRCATG